MSDEETIREALILLDGHSGFPAREALSRLCEQNKRMREALSRIEVFARHSNAEGMTIVEKIAMDALREALAASDTASEAESPNVGKQHC